MVTVRLSSFVPGRPLARPASPRSVTTTGSIRGLGGAAAAATLMTALLLALRPAGGAAGDSRRVAGAVATTWRQIRCTRRAAAMPSAWRIQARRSTRVRFNSLLSSGVALRGGLPRKPAARACRMRHASFIVKHCGMACMPPKLRICDYMGTSTGHPCRGARARGARFFSLTGHHRWCWQRRWCRWLGTPASSTPPGPRVLANERGVATAWTCADERGANHRAT